MKKILSFVVALALVLSTFMVGGVYASAASAPVKTDGTYYVITNVGAGKVLNVYCNSSANNANITLWDDDGTSGVHYMFAKNGSGYLIKPQCATNRAVNIYTARNASNGSNVCTWTVTKDSTQTWIPEAVSGGYILRSANNKNLVLTAAGAKNGSNVLVKTYSRSNKYQVWKFSEVKQSSWMWPCSTKSLSCPYGDTYYHRSAWHRGVDIPVSYGNVYASRAGTAYYMGYNSARGYWVVIDHGDGYYSAYQHLKSGSVKVSTKGTAVKQGQVIATSGNTGDSTGPHLHFEIQKIGKTGLAKSYNNYYNKTSLFVNTNPKQSMKAGFYTNQKKYVSTYSDQGGISYSFK